MQYLCLIYGDERTWEQRTQPENAAIFGEYMALTQELRQNGHLLGGSRLQPVAMASTVRVREGQTSTTDGPFAETKEQLGGYMLLEAADLNEAIRLAARIPGARWGSVEVRPLAVP